MATQQELEQRVNSALSARWDGRAGTVVPASESVNLIGGVVKLEATMLYADLADSTKIVLYDQNLACRLFKSYLACCTDLIRSNEGHVRSFDGDRVLGVFLGDYKNTNAAKCAMNINYAFEYIIRPKMEAKFESCRDGTIPLSQSVGIDTSTVYTIRTGIRNNNDLVWVGRAANIAAKLSSIREDGYSTYITDAVFQRLNEEAKSGGNPPQLMWEARSWTEGKKYDVGTVHRSGWWMRVPQS